MIIVNSQAGKGIEIPEIEITLSEDKQYVTFGAIDKEKYTSFLALKPMLITRDSIDQTYSDYYEGDEKVIPFANANLPIEVFISVINEELD